MNLSETMHYWQRLYWQIQWESNTSNISAYREWKGCRIQLSKKMMKMRIFYPTPQLWRLRRCWCYGSLQEKMRGKRGQGKSQGEKPNLACTFFPQICRILNRSELLNPVFVHSVGWQQRLSVWKADASSYRNPMDLSVIASN